MPASLHSLPLPTLLSPLLALALARSLAPLLWLWHGAWMTSLGTRGEQRLATRHAPLRIPYTYTLRRRSSCRPPQATRCSSRCKGDGHNDVRLEVRPGRPRQWRASGQRRGGTGLDGVSQPPGQPHRWLYSFRCTLQRTTPSALKAPRPPSTACAAFISHDSIPYALRKEKAAARGAANHLLGPLPNLRAAGSLGATARAGASYGVRAAMCTLSL